jgi:hypothetical protein
MLLCPSFYRSQAKPNRSRSFRPRLEILEDRLVPAYADGKGAVITNLSIQNSGSQLIITFDGPLTANPVNSAQSPTNTSNYAVEVPSTNPQVVTNKASAVSITSATYNSASFRVTLNLATALA